MSGPQLTRWFCATRSNGRSPVPAVEYVLCSPRYNLPSFYRAPAQAAHSLGTAGPVELLQRLSARASLIPARHARRRRRPATPARARFPVRHCAARRQACCLSASRPPPDPRDATESACESTWVRAYGGYRRCTAISFAGSCLNSLAAFTIAARSLTASTAPSNLAGAGSRRCSPPGLHATAFFPVREID